MVVPRGGDVARVAPVPGGSVIDPCACPTAPCCHPTRSPPKPTPSSRPFTATWSTRWPRWSPATAWWSVGMAQNPVVKKARALLTAEGIAFTYLEYGSYLSEWKRRLAIKLWPGFPTFPMVFIDGALVGGHRELLKLKEAGKAREMSPLRGVRARPLLGAAALSLMACATGLRALERYSRSTPRAGGTAGEPATSALSPPVRALACRWNGVAGARVRRARRRRRLRPPLEPGAAADPREPRRVTVPLGPGRGPRAGLRPARHLLRRAAPRGASPRGADGGGVDAPAGAHADLRARASHRGRRRVLGHASPRTRSRGSSSPPRRGASGSPCTSTPPRLRPTSPSPAGARRGAGRGAATPAESAFSPRRSATRRAPTRGEGAACVACADGTTCARNARCRGAAPPRVDLQHARRRGLHAAPLRHGLALRLHRRSRGARRHAARARATPLTTPTPARVCCASRATLTPTPRGAPSPSGCTTARSFAPRPSRAARWRCR